MKVRDVMTEPVISIDQEAPVGVAIRLMLQRKISGLPVVDAAGDIVGVVTEGDFLRRFETGTRHVQPRWLEFLMGPGLLAEEFTKTHGRKVSEVMSRDLKTVDEETPLNEVVALMERFGIKRIPVLRGRKPVGIVTRANLLRTLATYLHLEPASSATDAEIRERILQELKSEKWAPVATVDAMVQDGVVTLSGYLLDERQRVAIKVLVENVAGVKAVRDEMVWVDPISGVTIDPKQERLRNQH
jgi:CBS domain-containing protein